jgi:hypothetical protein
LGRSLDRQYLLLSTTLIISHHCVIYHAQGEKRLEEIGRLTSATAKLITMFEDPWEELTFRNVGNQGRIFNAVEDRFLLCLTHLHG